MKFFTLLRCSGENYSFCKLIVLLFSQSLYALRVLRHHGLGEDGLRTVFWAVVVSRLIYQRQRGLDLSPVQISSALKHSFTAASEVVTVRRICQTLHSWWRKATIGCSEKSSTINSSHVLHGLLQCFPSIHRSSNTTCGVVHMIGKCPNTRDTWPIKTS